MRIEARVIPSRPRDVVPQRVRGARVALTLPAGYDGDTMASSIGGTKICATLTTLLSRDRR